MTFIMKGYHKNAEYYTKSILFPNELLKMMNSGSSICFKKKKRARWSKNMKYDAFNIPSYTVPLAYYIL